MQGQRIVFARRGAVEVSDFDVRGPRADELLVETRLTLISPGTERACLLGLENTSGHYPQTPGYCQVGTVAEIGSAVEGFSPGDLVATPAGHASHVVVPAARALPIPACLPPEHAVFFHMVVISIQGVRKARVELGESVVVIGQGLVGNFAMQLARLSGGVPTTAVDTSDHRLDLARQCGADATCNPQRGNVDDLQGHVVIEATGFPEPISTAFQIADRCGRVVLLGSTRGETEKVNFYRDVHKKGLVIYGAHNGIRPKQDSTGGFWTERADFETAMTLLAAKRIVVAPLISKKVHFADAPAVYGELMDWDETLVGAILQWD